MRVPNARRRASSRAALAQHGAWSLLIAIPLDAVGLYLTLAALHLIPTAWPAAERSSWVLLAAAVVLFALARAIALTTLRRLLRWRAASDAWSKMVSQGSRSR